MTGMIGGVTGSAVICQAKGEVMSVRRFLINFGILSCWVAVLLRENFHQMSAG
jgi:hypothetical protein